MNMKIHEYAEGQGSGTMGVDAKGNMFFAPAFVEQATAAQAQGIIAHECLHSALQHMNRVGGRYPVLSNIAQDIVVNMMVQKAGMELMMEWNVKGADGNVHKGKAIPVDIHTDVSQFEMPMKNGMVKIKIEHVSEKPWEQVYTEVLAQMREQGKDPADLEPPKMPGFDEHGYGKDGESGEDLSDEEQTKQNNQWRENLANAAVFARNMGKLPAGLDRIIDDILKAKVQWKQLLRRYVKQFTTPVDWSYNRPAKRSHVLEVFMPNVIKENTEIEILVDVSGSIGGDDLKEFLSEIIGMARAIQNLKMWVTFCDAEVHERYEVHNGDIPKILNFKISGGGGTDLRVGLDNIAKKNNNIPVVVVITDGYTPFYEKNPHSFNVIWCISTNGINVKDLPYGIGVKMG